MFRKKVEKFLLPTLLLFFLGITSGCQRDDICPDSTAVTPMLNIAFFDADETDIPKPPVNLRVRAAEYDTIYVNRYNDDVISIPLRANADITEYEFTINAPEIPSEGEEVPGENTNMDRIIFSYSREEIYVNRACSYKVHFLNLQVGTRNDDSNTWIERLAIQEPNIENETDVHLHIYH